MVCQGSCEFSYQWPILISVQEPIFQKYLNTKTCLCFNALSGIASWTFSVCIDAFSQWSKKIYKPQNLTTFSFFSRRSFDWTTFSKLSSWSALLVCLDPSTVVKLNVTVVLSSKKRYVNKTMLWIAYLQLVSDN